MRRLPTLPIPLHMITEEVLDPLTGQRGRWTVQREKFEAKTLYADPQLWAEVGGSGSGATVPGPVAKNLRAVDGQGNPDYA